MPYHYVCISPPCPCPEDSASSPQWHSEQHHSGPCLLPSVTWSSHPHPCHVPLPQTWRTRTWSCPTLHQQQPYEERSRHPTRRHCWRHMSHLGLMLCTTNTCSHQLQPEVCGYIKETDMCTGTYKIINIRTTRQTFSVNMNWVVTHVCGNAPRLAAITQDWCCRNSLVKLWQKIRQRRDNVFSVTRHVPWLPPWTLQALDVATTTAEKMTAAVMIRWRRGQSNRKANDGATRTAT